MKTSRPLYQLCITFCNVQVEEVDVKNSLNAPSYHRDRVEEALSVVSVDPVNDVKCTVGAQHEEVVTEIDNS